MGPRVLLKNFKQKNKLMKKFEGPYLVKEKNYASNRIYMKSKGNYT